MIEKLGDKNLNYNVLFDIGIVIAKLNQLIEASNEQEEKISTTITAIVKDINNLEKKIDFIMENTNSNETESVDDSINIRHTNRTLKQLYEK
jgi:cell division protein FtsB